MPLQNPIWAPLTNWHHYYGNQAEDFLQAQSRPRERTLSTPDEVHYHLSAPHQVVWTVAHWLHHAGHLKDATDLPAALSTSPHTGHHIPVNPTPYWVDCTGNTHQLQQRAISMLLHYGIDPDTFHIGNQTIPGAYYSAVRTDLQRERNVARHHSPATYQHQAGDTLYHQALDISISAMRHARTGEPETATRLYADAYTKGAEALADSYTTHPNNPNFGRYLIATSAGWCAVNAGMVDEAINMAHVAGLSAVDLNRSIPDLEHPDIIPLLTGVPRRIMNAAAATNANAEHIPPRLQLDPTWLKHFMSTLAQHQQLPPDYVQHFSDQHWSELANFIIEQACADGTLTKIISQYADDYIDAGYTIN